MKKIKCDNINIKILLNENDCLKREVTRLKRELWQIHAETNALHTVTMPILKNRIAWCDEENKKEINNLKRKIQEARKETAEKILNELYVQFSADYLVGLRNEYKDWKYADLIKRYAKQFGVEIKE